MQLASSIRYGGLLINAADCNYDDYRKLGLTCPNCHESVFLVKEHDRFYRKTSKTTEVGAHFNHRSDKSKDAIALCELRNRQITTIEIQKSKVKSKNQRLQLFNRHLWTVLLTCYKLRNEEQQQRATREGFTSVCKSGAIAEQVLNAYKDFLIKGISEYKNNIISEADFFVKDLIKKVSNDKLVLSDDLQAILALWRQQIDVKMQVEIYSEAVSCLLQKKHLPVLEKLIVASLANFVNVTALTVDLSLKDNDRTQLYNSFFSGDIEVNPETVQGVYQALVDSMLARDSERLSAVYHFVRDDILETIALTSWAEGFEKCAGA